MVIRNPFYNNRFITFKNEKGKKRVANGLEQNFIKIEIASASFTLLIS